MPGDKEEPNVRLPGVLGKLASSAIGDVVWGLIGAAIGAAVFGLAGTVVLGWSAWGSLKIGALAGAIIGVLARGLFRPPLD